MGAITVAALLAMASFGSALAQQQPGFGPGGMMGGRGVTSQGYGPGMMAGLLS